MGIKHFCGICGYYSPDFNAQTALYQMLLQLQHRGQLSAGVTVLKEDNPFLLKTHKNIGLVNSVFRAERSDKFGLIMDELKSTKGIGHVRYATCGADDIEYAQPFEHFHGLKNRWFCLSFNGNIANYERIRTSLEEKNYHFVRENDTEAIMLLLSKALKEKNSVVEAFSSLSNTLDGSYNIAFMNAEGTLVGARDPLGLRPMCYAERDGRVAFASESVALQSIGFDIDEIKPLEPGKLIIHEKNKPFRIEEFSKSAKKAHCFFEWVYFAHAASKIEGKVVYQARNDLGKELAKLETEKIDSDSVVVAVPDSSTPAGNGFAEELGIPLREGLIRNRYVGRTFIESKDRSERVKSKFTLIKEIFEGKKVFLVEDSIVRGTTLKNLVSFIRKYGSPKEVHVRVSCPPILWPCFYGIDMSTKSELIAVNKKIDEIAEEIGADTLIYQNIPGLISAIGLEEKDLCLACLNGEYPTKSGKENADKDEGKGRKC
jgi:amidophosphoribosyltransferase